MKQQSGHTAKENTNPSTLCLRNHERMTSSAKKQKSLVVLADGLRKPLPWGAPGTQTIKVYGAQKDI